MTIVSHRERQFMQYLGSGGWANAANLPPGRKLIESLLNKGWIEQRGTEKELTFRITDNGLDAKRAPVPIFRSRKRPIVGSQSQH